MTSCMPEFITSVVLSPRDFFLRKAFYECAADSVRLMIIDYSRIIIWYTIVASTEKV